MLSAGARKFLKAGLLELGHNEPLVGRLEVHLKLFPPDRRIRDIDNHVKAVFDLLTKANVWEDDSQVDVLHVKRCDIVKKGKVEIEISCLEQKVDPD
jgi:crossover junction endodeoxyribonuclease RusA